MGELLVRLDLLTTFEVQTLLARQTRADPGTGLGLLAVEAGLIEPGELIAALKAQVLEVMTELATWRSGSFVFGERPPSASRLLGGHGFDMTLLLMEVLGRLELWQRGSVEPNSVFERVGDPTQVSLPQSSWEVLACVDGKRSARSIAAELDLPGREVYYLLHELQT